MRARSNACASVIVGSESVGCCALESAGNNSMRAAQSDRHPFDVATDLIVRAREPLPECVAGSPPKDYAPSAAAVDGSN